MNKSLDYIFPHVPQNIDLSQLDTSAIPSHVALIMDGNGRWAKSKGKIRLQGHKAGIEAVRESIRCASDLGVRFLTIYSFSSENWKRPEDEVSGLMNLFAQTMLAEVDGLHAEGVRVVTIGNTSALPKKTRDAFQKAYEQTKNNSGMTLVIAVNYGARQEILDAACAYARMCVERAQNGGEESSKEARANNGRLANEDALLKENFSISEEEFSQLLYTKDIPDPDVIIRTSGEKRLSNFLLWQAAYAEFVITDVLWPDFDRYELLRCLIEFQHRTRRFGAV